MSVVERVAHAIVDVSCTRFPTCLYVSTAYMVVTDFELSIIRVVEKTKKQIYYEYI